MKTLCLYCMVLFLPPTLAAAQSIDIGGPTGDGTYHPVIDVVINVSIDRIQNAAPAGLDVRMIDPSGSGLGKVMPGSQETDAGGRVTFHAPDGSYQIQINGPGIDEYDGTIQIMRMEGRHIERIVVHSKSEDANVVRERSGSAAAVSASSFKIPHKAESEFKKGSKAIENKAYPEAIKRFQNAVAIYPDYSGAFNGLGVAQMASNQISEARASFEKAIKIDDHFAEAYRNLARIALADHNFEEMDDLLTKSLSSEPLNAWALTYAAYAELQTHKFGLAIAHARAAHAVAHPGLASVHIVAADALEATQQPAEAVKEYRLYLSEDANGRDAPRAKEAIKRLTAAK